MTVSELAMVSSNHNLSHEIFLWFIRVHKAMMYSVIRHNFSKKYDTEIITVPL